jgi:AhpD family alkylhydroperoxidase
MSQQPRLPHTTLAPEAFKGMIAVSMTLLKSSLGKRLQALLHTRVSQINHCAYCLDMHTREALAAGEDAQRLALLPAWQETTLFDARERAALQWAESLTQLPVAGAPQEHFDALRPHFSDQEIAELTFSIAQINAWNRLGVGMHLPVPAKALPAAA